MREQPPAQTTPEPVTQPAKTDAKPVNIPPIPKKKSKKFIIVGLLVLIVFVLSFGGIIAYINYRSKKKPEPASKSTPQTTQIKEDNEANIIPTNYPDYKEDITDNLNIDLSKVKYFSDYESYLNLTDEAKQNLSKYGFTVQNVKKGDNEFFEHYQRNKFSYYANFITTDSVLHLMHKNFEYLLKQTEKHNLLLQLEDIVQSGLSKSKNSYEINPNNVYNKIAFAYFLVGAQLLEIDASIPSDLQNYINQELDLVENGNQIMKSIILNLDNPTGDDIVKIDYSQFTVRGYYNENDNLKRYFKGFMWLSLPTINLQTERGMSLSQHLALIMTSNPQAMDSYNKVMSFITFFTNIPSNVSLEKMNKYITNNGNNLSTNIQILLDNKNNPLEKDKDYLQFSYFPRASLLDNYIFQNEEKIKISKLFPSTIEIPAAYGSEEAINIAKNIGFTQIYNNNEYVSGLEELKNNVVSGQSNLYNQWMNTLNPLLDYPSNSFIFSSTRAWLRKNLVTYISSWTELRHSMVLYAKMRGAGGGGTPPKRDDRGLVEPYPEVYNGIISTIDYIFNHFQSNNLLDVKVSNDFKDLQTFVKKINEIAVKEVNNETLTTEEYNFIRDYGHNYQELWLNTFTEEQIANSSVIDLMQDNPAALVVDVDADEDGRVLHSGNGFAQKITVIFELDGEKRFASGLVYSNYEFKQQNKRLTDKEWRTMLRSSPKNEDYIDIENTPWQEIYLHKKSINN
ncbi:DUF3160 domain-containing protein [Patescibacteria group bacterium]